MIQIKQLSCHCSGEVWVRCQAVPLLSPAPLGVSSALDPPYVKRPWLRWLTSGYLSMIGSSSLADNSCCSHTLVFAFICERLHSRRTPVCLLVNCRIRILLYLTRWTFTSLWLKSFRLLSYTVNISVYCTTNSTPLHHLPSVCQTTLMLTNKTSLLHTTSQLQQGGDRWRRTRMKTGLTERKVKEIKRSWKRNRGEEERNRLFYDADQWDSNNQGSSAERKRM